MSTAVDRSPEGGPIPRGGGREAIAAAAREVFEQRGYHGASIRDIAKRAGLSLSALYYWHPSKQDLLAALIEENTLDYFRRCDEALASAGEDPADRLRALVKATVEYRVQRQTESNISSREWRNLEPAHEERLAGLRTKASTIWSDIVDAGVAQGTFRCEHPADARRAAQAACNAIAQWYDPAGPVTMEELVEHYTLIVMRIVDHPA
ncbi:TetR/AcrR family transcriptional regulator [Pseudonocardia sp. RS11V-5]|uniref:TetR/AcrR family transcriptional regulator n=1 Tax=Pseudonocardia terrae TaxID=2905831 RepID=UPI001E5C0504|nr:TetR/AcrR family transcriptional regulator [Pseudonocardia terrae]MCE3550219.1 TetR/AcrR family transcriptional regulator [Pseudonocardia terrae]